LPPKLSLISSRSTINQLASWLRLRRAWVGAGSDENEGLFDH
jgi:hypothetical protein